MMLRRFLIGACLLGLFSDAPGACQSLADLAREERKKQQKAKKVYTNEDLSKYEGLRSPAPVPTAAEAVTSSGQSAKGAMSTPDDSSERAWSKRFIEAKARVQESKVQSEALQTKLNDLNLKLLRQSDVYDRENVYGPLIAQTKQQIEQNKSEAVAAQQALEDLREDLRKNGGPASWENSEAALKPDPKETKSEAPKTKDQKYWQEKLATIDKRYNALIAPLEAERFQLVNRRPLKDGETPSPSGALGLGVPPRVIDIDVQIKDLNQKREQEKQELVSQAIREGALPGWFR
ncbi:MAG: hypothetical protein L0387_41270 [Acidobacteria bacterium]|nr:hypothetical protein [Acidobacteriota bacterium]MCI0628020.1 hypothetical protein [Acidobacteriota bacterium]MCI0722186.1 hypothetical protein [Acidobacteriota bacterium]